MAAFSSAFPLKKVQRAGMSLGFVTLVILSFGWVVVICSSHRSDLHPTMLIAQTRLGQATSPQDFRGATTCLGGSVRSALAFSVFSRPAWAGNVNGGDVDGSDALAERARCWSWPVREARLDCESSFRSLGDFRCLDKEILIPAARFVLDDFLSQPAGLGHAPPGTLAPTHQQRSTAALDLTNHADFRGFSVPLA